MEEKKFVEQEAKEEVRELTEPELEEVVGGVTISDERLEMMRRQQENNPIAQGEQAQLNLMEAILDSINAGR